MTKLNETAETDKVAKKMKELASAVVAKMDKLGVTRLANVYTTHVDDNTHGPQTYLHIDGDEHKSDLHRSRIDNSHDDYCDYGDFSLPFVLPDLDTALEFLGSVDDINNAIDDINDKIKKASDTDTTLR